MLGLLDPDSTADVSATVVCRLLRSQPDMMTPASLAILTLSVTQLLCRFVRRVSMGLYTATAA